MYMYAYFAHCCCFDSHVYIVGSKCADTTDTGGTKKKASKKQSELYFSCVLICKDYYIVDNTFRSVQSSKPFFVCPHTEIVNTAKKRPREQSGGAEAIKKPPKKKQNAEGL